MTKNRESNLSSNGFQSTISSTEQLHEYNEHYYIIFSKLTYSRFKFIECTGSKVCYSFTIMILTIIFVIRPRSKKTQRAIALPINSSRVPFSIIR